MRNDEHQDGSVYEMHVSGGYYFDDYLAQGGASNDGDLIDFITGNITKGLIDMTISESSIGCSSFTGQTAEGDRIFGRNYDFDKTNTCIVFDESRRGPPCICFHCGSAVSGNRSGGGRDFSYGQNQMSGRALRAFGRHE